MYIEHEIIMKFCLEDREITCAENGIQYCVFPGVNHNLPSRVRESRQSYLKWWNAVTKLCVSGSDFHRSNVTDLSSIGY